ncbi:hypothetical protein AB0368_15930 [Actinoplanes sp. NPDC051475]|uniref:hypothetical protein n=1 Tax=Actinoplanes sp. NPDC051475 TaxID=3157225 RepID=UPI00344BB048
MGELAERLSLLNVEAQSPDGWLTATARGRGDVRVAFAWDTYRSYRAATLVHQLEALATLLWSRYRRRYMEIVASWIDQDEAPEITDEDREFQRRLEELNVAGVSAAGWMTIRSRALVSWQVQLAGEPVGSLTEQQFLAELDSAVAALLADHQAKVTLLTDAVYDIGLPRSMRTAGQGVS